VSFSVIIGGNVHVYHSQSLSAVQYQKSRCSYWSKTKQNCHPFQNFACPRVKNVVFSTFILKHKVQTFSCKDHCRQRAPIEMFRQHPEYYKAVFLKKTQTIIVSFYEYIVYIMFWIMMLYVCYYYYCHLLSKYHCFLQCKIRIFLKVIRNSA
jgi:hypothetical protein